jgi:hypothetical protein
VWFINSGKRAMSNDRQRIQYKRTATGALTQLRKGDVISYLESGANNAFLLAYLQHASIDGELEYLGFWRNNSSVQAGQELFSIIPDKNSILGEVMIPSFGRIPYHQQVKNTKRRCRCLLGTYFVSRWHDDQFREDAST